MLNPNLTMDYFNPRNCCLSRKTSYHSSRYISDMLYLQYQISTTQNEAIEISYAFSIYKTLLYICFLLLVPWVLITLLLIAMGEKLRKFAFRAYRSINSYCFTFLLKINLWTWGYVYWLEEDMLFSKYIKIIYYPSAYWRHRYCNDKINAPHKRLNSFKILWFAW